MFIESSIEDYLINTDQVLYFEIVKLGESDPVMPGNPPHERWFLVAHMRDGHEIKMESSIDPETLDEMMRNYLDQIEEYASRR